MQSFLPFPLGILRHIRHIDLPLLPLAQTLPLCMCAHKHTYKRISDIHRFFFLSALQTLPENQNGLSNDFDITQ